VRQQRTPVSGSPDQDWARRYARGLALSDFAVIAWAVVGAQLLRFGVSSEDELRIGRGFDLGLNYTVITIVFIVAWTVMLSVFKTRAPRIVGIGSTEYRLVTQATLWLFGLAAILLFLFKIDIARAYVLIALPLGLLLLLLGRWLWRQWLRAKRSSGQWSDRAVLVGSLESVVSLARDLARASSAGYRVVAAVVPNASGIVFVPGTSIPLTTDVDGILPTMRELDASTLIVTGSDELPSARVRELSWGLDPGRQHLVMAPSLTDVGGPRIHMRPVAGLPLMHVETPAFAGAQLFVKRLFDFVGSLVLIVVGSPVLIAVAIAVRVSSRGPVLFRQERIGFQGRPFRMLKFRSMVEDAEVRLASLLDGERDAGNAVMFKLRDDPRVTRVGRFIRRFSLDELPQLFNVFAGQMSLVGPRPPLPREVETYDDRVNRKFLVKPGITGLWQIGGRSQLSWEESVRLDLYYVENWSVVGDLVILWRTLKAVLGRVGAY